jgi:ParB-like chromosome segregation protein Spo0J
MEETGLQLALIKAEGKNPKLKKISLTELPSLEELDLEKGQPDNAFVQDIVNRGQLEPITVISIAPNKYSIVAGNKRTAAFIRLNEFDDSGDYNKILAMVVNESEEAAVTGAVASNQMRHANAITDLKGIKYLAEKYPSMGDKAVALSLGMNLGTFKRRKKLLKLNDILFQAMVEGKVAIKVAEFIADRLYLQDGAIAKIAEDKVVSMESLKELERNRKNELVASKADQLGLGIQVPAIPVTDAQIVEEKGLTLLGVAYLHGSQFVSEVLEEQSEEAQKFEDDMLQKVYVFGSE